MTPTRTPNHAQMLYAFPASNLAGLPVVLSYANGFLPQTYARALQPLFVRYHVMAAHLRPMWQPAPAVGTLRDWHTFGDDLLRQLDALKQDRVIAIGHSVGAIATAYAAIKEPERFLGVALIDPTMLPVAALNGIRLIRLLGREARIPLVQQALRRGHHWPDVESAYHYFRGKRLFTRWSDDQVRAYSESMTAPDSDGTAAVHLIYPPEWEAHIYKTLPTDVWTIPARLQVPTLVLRGELTDIFTERNARRFARLQPRAQITLIPAAGHLIPQEQPEAVGRALLTFVDGLP